jgi:hypothetical protein
MYRYFAYRRLAKVAGPPGGTKQTIGAVTGPSACWDEADTPSTGRPRSMTHPDALLTRRGGQSYHRTWESGKYRMKYLLNLPLAVAALLQVWFSSLVFMSPIHRGERRAPLFRIARGSAAQRSRQRPNKVYSVIREKKRIRGDHTAAVPGPLSRGRQLLFLMRSLQWT